MLRRLLLIIGPFILFCAIVTGAGIRDWRRSLWESKYRPVDVARLGYFNIDQTRSIENIPTEYRQLDGARVRLDGAARNACTIRGISQFELLGKLGPGLPPMQQVRVLVTTRNSKCAGDIPGPARVYGTLRVRAPDLQSPHIFTLEAENVEIFSANVPQIGPISALSTLGGISLLLAIAICWIIHQRAADRMQRRLAAGFCVQCGYDLRAGAARCPECGTSTVMLASSSPGFIRVSGILHVRVKYNELGEVSSVFDMDVEKVEPAR